VADIGKEDEAGQVARLELQVDGKRRRGAGVLAQGRRRAEGGGRERKGKRAPRKGASRVTPTAYKPPRVVSVRVTVMCACPFRTDREGKQLKESGRV